MAHTSAMNLLPTEIKIVLLCNVPDIKTLQSLAHASLAFHQAYLRARDSIFQHVTLQILRADGIDNITEPLAAIRAPIHGEYEVGVKDKINKFLDQYSQGFPNDRNRLEIEDCLQILSMHRRLKALAEDYCTLNLERNPLHVWTSHLKVDIAARSTKINEPSSKESERIYRALHRWEIYSRLFGGTKYPSYSTRDHFGYHVIFPGHHGAEEVEGLFLGHFPIHEVEELACIHSYAKHFYTSCVSQPYIDYVLSLGPTFMYRVLKTSGEERYNLLTSYFDTTAFHLRSALDTYERVVDGGEWPWKGRDDPSNLHRIPTEGWLWAIARGPQNTDLKLRRWGYVFWDRERLDGWGVTKEHMLNWQWPL